MLLQGQFERLSLLPLVRQFLLFLLSVPSIFTVYAFIFSFSYRYSITFPLHPLVISRAIFTLPPFITLLYFHCSNICFPFIYSSFFLPANIWLALLFISLHFISLSPHSSALLFTPHAHTWTTPIGSNFVYPTLPSTPHPNGTIWAQPVFTQSSHPPACLHVPYSSTLMIQTVDPLIHHYTPSKAHGVTYQKTYLHNHCYENVKSNLEIMSLATFRFQLYWYSSSRVFCWPV
jgi:hypothetical protein